MSASLFWRFLVAFFGVKKISRNLQDYFEKSPGKTLSVVDRSEKVILLLPIEVMQATFKPYTQFSFYYIIF